MRAVRVVTENAAIDRAFDYEVPETMPQVRVGDQVRVDFHHRSLRGWVVADVAPSRAMKPIKKWLGFGPPPELLALCDWAGSRWLGPVARFLAAASPVRLVHSIPVAPDSRSLPADLATQLTPWAPGLWQVAPSEDPLDLVLSAHQQTWQSGGSLLVLVPTEAWAQRLRGRLEQRGLDVASGDAEWAQMRAEWPIIVGARGAAFAPTPRVRGAVIIDADDDVYRSEASPTWHASDVVIERCRRDNAPWWMSAVAPSPRLLSYGSAHPSSLGAAGWPAVELVDRRDSDPRDGVLLRPAYEAAHRALEGVTPVAVAVVLQRLGTGRLWACGACRELARCATCQQAEQLIDDHMTCLDRHDVREPFCRHCGSTNVRRVQSGVTTLARDVAAQLGVAVSEVTAATTPTTPLERVVVGTEAIFSRVRRADVVIFVDFDQYLLAPREEARRAAILAVSKAGRLVGSRAEARGKVLIQSRRDDNVMTALVNGDVSAVVLEDNETALLLAMPPYGGWATISGPGAAAYVAALPTTVKVATVGDEYVVRAPSTSELVAQLAEVERPSGRLRVAVD